MEFPSISFEEWKAQVERDLAGAPFEKVLVQATAEGIPVQPLYASAPPVALPARASEARFLVVPRHRVADAEAIAEDVAGGADGLWLAMPGADACRALGAHALDRLLLVLEVDDPAEVHAVLPAAAPAGLVVAFDPMTKNDPSRGLDQLARAADGIAARWPAAQVCAVSTLPYHDQGADAADELAIALSTGAAYLAALETAGMSTADAARRIAVQVAAGRDTFLELCKLRALRILWQKLCAAAGAPAATLARLHAVTSERTATRRDPFVNMLRATTQVFAAALGGADLVTVLPHDRLIAPVSSRLARRVARNTGLVLREESALGAVQDPAAGAYFFETVTDQLARAAWERFRALERGGGVIEALRSGRLREQLAASWQRNAARVAKRQASIVGVSEFADPGERVAPGQPGTARRDAEAFEALGDALAKGPLPGVALELMGPPAEHRARAGFARAFFAVAGVTATDGGAAPIVCLCGADERYATEAAERARALRAGGARRVVLAGRPGALEAALREAGVTDFIFLGCDVPAVLAELFEVKR